VLVATAAGLLHPVHMAVASQKRKASGVKYPTAYATEEQAAKNPAARTFNCAQRAHANYIENLTSFLVALAVAGLRFPRPAVTLGAVWLVGRVAYLAGYISSAGPSGRRFGFYPSALADFLLKGFALVTAWGMATAA
jgi:glutathione S-transferase